MVVGNHVSLCTNFFLETCGLVGLLIEAAFRSLELIHKVAANFGLFSYKELQFFKGPSRICDLVAPAV